MKPTEKPTIPVREPNETFADFKKRMDEFEMHLFQERIAIISKDWNRGEHVYREPTPEELATARQTVREIVELHSGLYSKKHTHWIYDRGGLFYFNSAENLKDQYTLSDAIEALREKYASSPDDHDIVLCDGDGNTKTLNLWTALRDPVDPAKHRDHPDRKTARRAQAKKPRYPEGKDPQLKRKLLMEKHNVDWFEAIKRWPLSDYDNWE